MRAPRPVIGEVDVAEARWYLPPRKGCSLSVHKERSWMVKFINRITDGPKSHSVTWVDAKSHVLALRECLQWAWDREHEISGMERPFELP